jgi:hypothetical protein
MSAINRTPCSLSLWDRVRERAGAVTANVTDRIGTVAGPHPSPLPKGERAIPELKSGETGYDVMRHLAGKASGGDRNLSTNPEHLARYGR